VQGKSKGKKEVDIVSTPDEVSLGWSVRARRACSPDIRIGSHRILGGDGAKKLSGEETSS